MIETHRIKIGDGAPIPLGTDLEWVLPGDRMLSLAWLDWDSRFFGLPCYRLRADRCRVPETPVSIFDLRKIAMDLPRCAVWAKIPPQAPPALVATFQALGGEFIETELTLGHNGNVIPPAPVNGVRVYKAENLNAPGFTALGRAFSLTRFHMDPQIGIERADALWTEYMKNARLSAHRHAFLAEAEGRVVGAILTSVGRIEDADVNILDIVAVASSHAGRGVGRALIRSVLSWSLATGCGAMVATQHRNTQAIAFYQKNGFSRVVSATPVFHLWTAKRDGGS